MMITCRRMLAAMVRIRALSVAVGVATLLGCARDDGTVTISGDVEGLDTLGLRGDSLIAQAGRLPSMTDSLQAVADGRISRPYANAGRRDSATPDSLGTAIASGISAMNARAHARGDSIARAEAAKYTAAAAGGGASGDTIRGIVTLLEDAPAAQAVLKTRDGATVTMSGMVTTGITQLAGTELVVRGVKITRSDIVVSSYVVRAIDGIPAADGRLQGGPSTGWSVELTDGSGRKRLSSLPAPLRGMEGSRIWIALPPDGTTARKYGVIAKR